MRQPAGLCCAHRQAAHEFLAAALPLPAILRQAQDERQPCMVSLSNHETDNPHRSLTFRADQRIYFVYLLNQPGLPSRAQATFPESLFLHGMPSVVFRPPDAPGTRTTHDVHFQRGFITWKSESDDSIQYFTISLFSMSSIYMINNKLLVLSHFVWVASGASFHSVEKIPE